MRKGTQVIRGIEYVYEDQPYWDSEKKRGTHKRVYIGKNFDGIFVPNKKYKLQQELDTLKSEVKPGPVPAAECKRTFCGATVLLDAISNKIGVTQDLKACFPEDYKAIQSLAYYLVLESAPLYRFKKWSCTHEHPYGKDIPSQRSSELLGRMTEEAKMKFFKKQSDRRTETEFLACDTTSISSNSQLIKQVKYGKNKEHDLLPQLNLLMLYGETSRLPVYYRKLCGNIPDVSTMENLLKDIDFLQMDKVNLVMDRGFYSEANINRLYHNHHKFLVASKTSIKFIQEKLKTIRPDFESRKNYHAETKLYMESFMMDWDYIEQKPRTGEEVHGKRRIYVYYYYNDQHATDDKARLNEQLDRLEYELHTKKDPEHQALYDKFFTISSTPVRGIKVEPKQEAIDKKLKDCGYFVLLSNEIKDPAEALRIYRTRDLVEKAFGDLKERLNMRREGVASEEHLEGKLFIQFIALIYLSYIKKEMDKEALYKNYTLQEFLDELDIIEKYQQPGCEAHYSEITEKQKNLYQYMKVEVPS